MTSRSILTKGAQTWAHQNHVAEFGPWVADSISLPHGIETNPKRPGPTRGLRRAVQVIADLSGKPWSQLRILDLGSLEGGFALEFASQGAEVVAIEGRESNNAHARFAAEAFGLKNVKFVTDDVRNLSREKYGQFDVVLCSGILYHLTGEDACRLVSSIVSVCRHLAIIDTHVGLKPKHSFRWNDRTYSGFLYQEHPAGDPLEVKSMRKQASLDNEKSSWFTRPSLLNLLRDAGFTSTCEVLSPGFCPFADRFTFVAMVGRRQAFRLSPELSNPDPDWPEYSTLAPEMSQVPRWRRIVARLRRAA